MIIPEEYEAVGGLRLEDIATDEGSAEDKEHLKKRLNDARESLAEFQDRMYAQGRYSVLICIQGMDTAGKDSLIREVFKEFNVRGVRCHSFKVPSREELRHDYLWRHYKALPPRGTFGVFNRTHYENVIVTRVHPEYLANEHIPVLYGADGFRPPEEAFWKQRFEQIRQFERHLFQNGILVFKFFLHLSREEQRRRLLRRLHRPDKNWKFSAGDLEERKLWSSYQEAYQEAISHTHTPEAPWFIIPSDRKRWARVVVAEILEQRLTAMEDVAYPSLDRKVQEQLDTYVYELENE